MEDIEYLEEYEDLVLPVINSTLSDATKTNATTNSGLITLNEEMSNKKTSSRATADIVCNQLQQVADSDTSSSLDQDIFNCLFDDHSDDDNILITKGDINATEKSDLNMYSMDSMDTFVKKIGEQVLNETSSAVAKTDKPSTSKNDSYKSLNKPTSASSSTSAGMTRGKVTKIAATSNVEARKSITRTPVKATIIPSKSLIKQKPPKNLLSTSTSNVSNYQANRKVAPSMAKVATKKQPHTTIVKLEKVISDDPVNDPLNLEDDTLSDVASDLLSLSDISGHTLDNLSVLDDDDDDDDDDDEDDDMLSTRKTMPNSPSDDEENDFMHNTQIMDLSDDSSVLSRNLQNIVTTSRSLVPKRGAVASTCTTISINAGPHDVGFKATPSNQSNRGLDLMVATDDKNLDLIDILSDNFREDVVVGDYTKQMQLVSDVNLGSSVESSSDVGRRKNLSSASSELYSTSTIATSTSAIMETLPPKAIIISDTILTPYTMPFTNFQASSLGNTTTNLPKFTTTTTSTLPHDHPTRTVESSNTNVFTQTPDPIKPIEITIRTMEAPSSSSAASTALGNIISPSGLSNDSYLSAVDEMLEESYAEAMLKLKSQQEMLQIQEVGAEMEVSYIDNLDFLNADDVQNKLILQEQQPSQPKCDKTKDDVLEKNQSGKQTQQETNLVTSLSDKMEQKGNEEQQQQQQPTIEDNMTVMFRTSTPSQQEQHQQQLNDSKDTTEEKPQQQPPGDNKVTTKTTTIPVTSQQQQQQIVGDGKLELVNHTNPQQQHEKKCKAQKYQQQQQQEEDEEEEEIKTLQKHQQQKQQQSNDNTATIKQEQHQPQKQQQQQQQHFGDSKVAVASQSGHHQRKEQSQTQPQARDNKVTESNNTTKQQQQSCYYKFQAGKEIADVLDNIHNKEKSTHSRNESAKQTTTTTSNSEKPTSTKFLKIMDNSEAKNKIEIKDNREPALKTVQHEANVNKKPAINTKLIPKESQKTANANKDPRVTATDTKTTNVDLPRSSIKEEKTCDKSVENTKTVPVERKETKESLKWSTTKIEEHNKKTNENDENRIKDAATSKMKTNINEMKKTKDIESNQPTTTTVTLINDQNAKKEAAKEVSLAVAQPSDKEKIIPPKKGAQEKEETNKIAENKSNVPELEKEVVEEKSGIKSNDVSSATTASKAKDTIKSFDYEKNPTSDKKMENVKILHEDWTTAYKLPAAKDKRDISAEKSLQIEKTEKDEFKAELKNIKNRMKDSQLDMIPTSTTTKPTQQTKKKRFRNLKTPDSSDEDFKDGLNDFKGFEEEANLKIVEDNKEVKVKTTSEDNNMATARATITNSKEKGDEMKETIKKTTRWDSLTNNREDITQSITTPDKEIINDKINSNETKIKSCTTETVKLTNDSTNHHKEEEKTEQKDEPRSSKESSNETNEVKKSKSFIEIKTNLNKNNEPKLVQDETKIKDNLAPTVDEKKTDEKVAELPTTISIQAIPQLEATLTTNADTTSTSKKLQDRNSESLENKSIRISEKTDKDKPADKKEETITSKPVLPVEAKTSNSEDDEKCTESPRNQTSKLPASKNTSLRDNKTTNNTKSAKDISRDGKTVENPKPSAKKKRFSQDSEGSRDSSKERKSSKDSNNIGKHRKDNRTSRESNESKECTEAREYKNDTRQTKNISRHSSRDSNNSDKRSDTRASSTESVKSSKEKLPPKQQVFPSPRTYKTQTKLSSPAEGKVIFSTKEVVPKQSVYVENKNVKDDKLPALSEADLKQEIKNGKKSLEKKDNTLEAPTGVEDIKKVFIEGHKMDEENLSAIKMPQLVGGTKETVKAELVKDNPVEGQANKPKEINANKSEDSAQKIVDKKDDSLKKEQEEEKKEMNEEEESAKTNNATELQKNLTQPTEATVAMHNKCNEVEKVEVEKVNEVDNETNHVIVRDLKTPNDQQKANYSSYINHMEDKPPEVVKEIIRTNTKESIPQNSDIAKKETNEKETIPNSQETLLNSLKLTVESSSSPNPKIIDEESAKKSRSASESSQCVSPTNSVTSQSSRSRRTPNPDNTPLRRTLRKRGVGSPFIENETEKKVFKEPDVPLGGDSKSENITEDASPSSAKKAKLDTQKKSLRSRKSQPLEREQDNTQLAIEITAPLTEATDVEEKSKQTSKGLITNNEVCTEKQNLDEETHTKAKKEQTKKTEQSSPLQENPTHSSNVKKNVRSDDFTKQRFTKTSGNSSVRKEPLRDKPQTNKTNDLPPKAKAINTTTSNLSNVISFSEWLQAQKKRKNQDQELCNKSSSTSQIQTQTKTETASKIEPAVTTTEVEEKVESTVDKKPDIATETIDAEAKSKAGKTNQTPQKITAERSGSSKMQDVKSCDDSFSSIDTTSTENLSETPKPRVKLSESQMLMASWSKTMKESGLELMLNEGKPEKRQRSSSSRKRQLMKDLEKSKDKKRGSDKVKSDKYQISDKNFGIWKIVDKATDKSQIMDKQIDKSSIPYGQVQTSNTTEHMNQNKIPDKMTNQIEKLDNGNRAEKKVPLQMDTPPIQSSTQSNVGKGKGKSRTPSNNPKGSKKSLITVHLTTPTRKKRSNLKSAESETNSNSNSSTLTVSKLLSPEVKVSNQLMECREVRILLNRSFVSRYMKLQLHKKYSLTPNDSHSLLEELLSLPPKPFTKAQFPSLITNRTTTTPLNKAITNHSVMAYPTPVATAAAYPPKTMTLMQNNSETALRIRPVMGHPSIIEKTIENKVPEQKLKNNITEAVRVYRPSKRMKAMTTNAKMPPIIASTTSLPKAALSSTIIDSISSSTTSAPTTISTIPRTTATATTTTGTTITTISGFNVLDETSQVVTIPASADPLPDVTNLEAMMAVKTKNEIDDDDNLPCTLPNTSTLLAHSQTITATATSAMNPLATNRTAIRVVPNLLNTASAVGATADNINTPGFGLTPPLVDGKCTRIYSFLHPARYANSHGKVLLDYCCPNLNGPMPAIDPQRIHAQVQVAVRELPAFVVLDTKVITRAELESGSIKVPEVVKQKVEKYRNSTTTTATTTIIINEPGNIRPILRAGPPSILQTFADNSNPNRMLSPTVNALAKHLPRTTTITPKVRPPPPPQPPPPPTMTTTTNATNASAITPLLQIGTEAPIAQPRTQLKQLDNVLKKFVNPYDSLTFAERHRIMESIVASGTFSCNDVEKMILLLEGYYKQIELLKRTTPSGSNSLTTRPTVTVKEDKDVASQLSMSYNNAIAAMSRTKPLKQQKPPGVKSTPKNSATEQVPIYDTDQNIIGYQMRTVKALPVQRTSTPMSAVNTSNVGARARDIIASTKPPQTTHSSAKATTSSSSASVSGGGGGEGSSSSNVDMNVSRTRAGRILKRRAQEPMHMYYSPTPSAKSSTSAAAALTSTTTTKKSKNNVTSTPSTTSTVMVKSTNKTANMATTSTITSSTGTSRSSGIINIRKLPTHTEDKDTVVRRANITTTSIPIPTNHGRAIETITTTTTATIKRVTRKRAAASSKIIVMSKSNANSEESILPDDNRQAVIKHELTDE